MPLLKEITAENGLAISYHVVSRMEIALADDSATVVIQSWHTEAQFTLGLPFSWTWTLTMPLLGLNLSQIEQSVSQTPEFLGASIIANVDGLVAARAKAWARMKHRRSMALSDPLVTPHGTFQCGPDERQNIANSVLLAQTLTTLGLPVQISFTLLNNTVANLNLTQMTQVGLLLGQRVEAVHTKARLRRAAIDVSTEPETIEWDDPLVRPTLSVPTQ